MKRFVVCSLSELKPGERKIFEAEGKSIGVFNIDGAFYGVRNVCPHQFAPLCLGKITGYCEQSEVGEFRWVREGEIVRCPWHGWEFDIKTGRSVFDPHRMRTKIYEAKVEPRRDSDETKSVETFPVKVEEQSIVLYV